MSFSPRCVLLSLILFSFSAISSATDINTIETSNQEPLRVAVTYFTPPFVDSTGGGRFMGFDINMMTYLCAYLKRQCKYYAMTFDELIPALEKNNFDLAVSGIVITAKRSSKVYMSSPYLLSESRFITYSSRKDIKLTRKTLQNTKVTVQKGSVFGEQLKAWNIKGLEVVKYVEENEEIEALSTKDVDYALMDNLTSIYWSNHSLGKLKVVGDPIRFGYGYGIAVNPGNKQLLNDINRALNAYLKSKQYIENYNFYIQTFKQ